MCLFWYWLSVFDNGSVPQSLWCTCSLRVLSVRSIKEIFYTKVRCENTNIVSLIQNQRQVVVQTILQGTSQSVVARIIHVRKSTISLLYHCWQKVDELSPRLVHMAFPPEKSSLYKTAQTTHNRETHIRAFVLIVHT